MSDCEALTSYDHHGRTDPQGSPAPATFVGQLGASAVGAVALPMGASALAGPAHPDAALFALLDAWSPARTAADAAGDRAGALWDTFVALEPARPPALHFSGADGLNCGFDVEVLTDGRRIALYGLQEVEKLRDMPQPKRSEWVGEPAPWGNGEQIDRWMSVPNERVIARLAEVIAAHDAWVVERQAVKDRLGKDAADEAEDEACQALWEVEKAILSTMPATIAGLTAKARWATRDGLPMTTAAEWAQRIAADVVAMAERGGVAS